MTDEADTAAALAALAARLDGMDRAVADLRRVTDEIRGLVGPFGAPMPQGRMLVQSLFGVKYLIDPADLVMAPQLIVYRQWEPDLSALFHNSLGPDSVVVDVGANFGYFTCLAGGRIGTSGRGRVIAVEPNPAMLELLRANVAINWSMCPIEVVEAAAGERAGRALLFTPKDKAANASLTAGAGDHVQVNDVAVRPLDEIVPDGLAVDLLKIDVEGHEAAVLRGARRMLAQSPDIVVIMEWSPGQMTAAGETPRGRLEVLRALGLTTWSLPPDGDLAAARPLGEEDLAATGHANLILRHA